MEFYMPLSIFDDEEGIKKGPENIPVNEEVNKEIACAFDELEEYICDLLKTANERRVLELKSILDKLSKMRKIKDMNAMKSIELREEISCSFKNIFKTTKISYHQFVVDGNTKGAVETHTILEKLEKIRMIALKYGIEI